ncbi:MAG: DUF3237 domain-containing protein [Candidatus Velthaea sp.]|jgi:hypothetical protein
MIPLRSEFLFTLTGSVGAPIEMASTPLGFRRIFPITGGTFEGPRLRGRLLPDGADYMLVRSDAVSIPDVRLVLETEEGHLILLSYGGFRHGSPEVMDRLARGELVDPSEYYFRIAPRFETGSQKYSWLNRILAVGTGHRLPTGPVYDVYEIL